MPAPGLLLNIHEDLHNFTRDLIQNIDLAVIAPKLKYPVYKLPFKEQSNITFPCIVVSLENEFEKYKWGTTEEQDWEIPFTVVIMDKIPFRNQKVSEYTQIRALIINAFEDVSDYKNLNIIRTLLDYSGIVSHKVMQLGEIVSQIRIRYWVRVQRKKDIDLSNVIPLTCIS